MQHGTYIMARDRGGLPTEASGLFLPQGPLVVNPAMLGTSVISVNNRISAFCDLYTVNQSISILE